MVVVLAFQHNMVDKNQQVIDKTIDQEYKYGFTTDVDQTKFEPGLDEEVITKLSKINDDDELNRFQKELKDKYGSLPVESIDPDSYTNKKLPTMRKV